MSRIKNKLFLKVILATFAFVIITLSSIFLLLSSKPSYNPSSVKVSAKLIDKIRVAEKQGALVEISSQELNEIISMYFKKEQTYKGISIKDVNGEIKNNYVEFNVPVAYKAFNFLVNSKCSLGYKDGKTYIEPKNIKVGKITIPKGLIFNKVKERLPKGVTIENNIVYIDNNILPIKIKSLDIKENKTLVYIEKSTNSLEDKIRSITPSLNKNSKEKTDSATNGDSPSTSNSPKEQDNYKLSSEYKDTSEMDAALDRISGGLNSAMGSVSSPGGQAVVSQVISSVNSMKGNPSANPYAAAGGVKAAYNKLTPAEKAEVKSAIFSNVNGTDINIVSKVMGK